MPTAGSRSFTGVSGRRSWGCPVPGAADPVSSPWGTPEALSHAAGASREVCLRNRKPERRREHQSLKRRSSPM